MTPALISEIWIKLRSHRWYRCFEIKTRLEFRSLKGLMIIELRGSDGEKGFQTVVPPSVTADWPDPLPLGDELPPVLAFTPELLPKSLLPLVEDISERMQTPMDYAAAAAIVALASCVNRRATMQPKAKDVSWQVISNLWGAIIAPPGMTGKRIYRRKAESEWRRLEIPEQRIISEELWIRTHERLKVVQELYGVREGKRRGRAAASPYLFVHQSFCGITLRVN